MFVVIWMDNHLRKCVVSKCMGWIYAKATRRPWRIKRWSGPNTQIFGTRRCRICGSAHCIHTWTYWSSKWALEAIKIPFCHIIFRPFQWLPSHCYAKEAYRWKTVRVKASYEGYNSRHGVKVKHYHTDNCISAGCAMWAYSSRQCLIGV